jgi:trigger factor
MTNQQFQIKETENQGLTRSFEVIINSNVMTQKIDSELMELGKQVKIAGFRSGKVPLPVLRQKYKDNVLRDALNESVEAALQATLTEHKITPALMPDIKVGDYEDGKDIQISIKIDVMPEVDDIDFSSITVEQPIIDISDEELDRELKVISRGNRNLEDKGENAVAENGDVVNFDFKGFVEDVAFEGGEATYFDLELGSEQFIPGFEEQMVGCKAGDAKDVIVSFPENYGKAELAGKEARFEIKVHKVQVAVDAEINDEFAKKMNFESADALRDAFKKMMEQQHQMTTRDYVKKKLFDELENLCSFDVPAKMLQLEAEEIERQTKNNNETLSVEECDKIARRRVQLGILLSTTAKRNGITVTNDELNQALQARLQAYPNNQKQVIEFYRKNPDRVQALAGPILEEKTVDFILSKAKIVEKTYSIEEFMKLEEDEIEMEEKK